MDELLSQVLHAGQGEISKQFDAHFAGRLPHLFKVLTKALRVEYGRFFSRHARPKRHSGQGGYNPGPININWFYWRPIVERVATLHEVETHWSIDDLADANEALDIKAEAEAKAAKKV